MRKTKGISLIAALLLLVSFTVGGYLASKFLGTGDRKQTPEAKTSLPSLPKRDNKVKVVKPAKPRLTIDQFEALVLKTEELNKLQKEFKNVKGKFKVTKEFEFSGAKGKIVKASIPQGLNYIFIAANGKVILKARVFDSQISAKYEKSPLGDLIKLVGTEQDKNRLRYTQTAYYRITPEESFELVKYISEIDENSNSELRLKTDSRMIEDRLIIDVKITRILDNGKIKTQDFETQLRWNKKRNAFELLSGRDINEIIRKEYFEKMSTHAE